MSMASGTLFDSALKRLEGLSKTLVLYSHRYTGIVTFTTAVCLSAPWLWHNYHQFLAIGPGGLPYNVRGWLVALWLKLWSRETLGTASYDADPEKRSWIEDPDGVPERRGTRPISGWHVLPARQFNKVPGEDIGVVSRF